MAHFFFAVTDLIDANGKLKTRLPQYKVPILYRWWFPKTLAEELLAKSSEDMLARVRYTDIGETRYYALYLGKGDNGRRRFANHIRKAKRFSTLRRTIGGLKGGCGEEEISAVLEKCWYEWCEQDCKGKDLEELEKGKIEGGFYPLNLKDNPYISPEWRSLLQGLRK